MTSCLIHGQWALLFSSCFGSRESNFEEEASLYFIRLAPITFLFYTMTIAAALQTSILQAMSQSPSVLRSHPPHQQACQLAPDKAGSTQPLSSPIQPKDEAVYPVTQYSRSNVD